MEATNEESLGLSQLQSDSMIVMNVDLGSLDDVNVDALPVLRNAETMTEAELNSICDLARSNELFSTDNGELVGSSSETPENQNAVLDQNAPDILLKTINGKERDVQALESNSTDFHIAANFNDLRIDCTCQKVEKRREEAEKTLYSAWTELRASLHHIHRSLLPISVTTSHTVKPSVKRMTALATMLLHYDPHQLYLKLSVVLEELCGDLKARILSFVSKPPTPMMIVLFGKALCESYQWLMNISGILQPVFADLDFEHLSNFNLNWNTINMHIFNTTIYMDEQVQEFVAMSTDMIKHLDDSEALIGCLNSLERTMELATRVWSYGEKYLREYTMERTAIVEKQQQLISEWEQFKAHQRNMRNKEANTQVSSSSSSCSDHASSSKNDEPGDGGQPALSTNNECYFCNCDNFNKQCSPSNNTPSLSGSDNPQGSTDGTVPNSSSTGNCPCSCTAHDKNNHSSNYSHIYSCGNEPKAGPIDDIITGSASESLEEKGEKILKKMVQDWRETWEDTFKMPRTAGNDLMDHFENVFLKSPKSKHLKELMGEKQTPMLYQIINNSTSLLNRHHNSISPTTTSTTTTSLPKPSQSPDPVSTEENTKVTCEGAHLQSSSSSASASCSGSGGTTPSPSVVHSPSSGVPPPSAAITSLPQQKRVTTTTNDTDVCCGGPTTSIQRKNPNNTMSTNQPTAPSSSQTPANNAVVKPTVSVYGKDCDNRQRHNSERSSRESDDESDLSDHDDWSTEDYSDGGSTTASSSNHQDQHCDCCVCHMMHQNQGGGRDNYNDRRDRLLQLLEKKKRAVTSRTVSPKEQKPQAPSSPHQSQLGTENIEVILDYIEGDDKGATAVPVTDSKQNNAKKMAKKARQRQKKQQKAVISNKPSSSKHGSDLNCSQVSNSGLDDRLSLSLTEEKKTDYQGQGTSESKYSRKNKEAQLLRQEQQSPQHLKSSKKGKSLKHRTDELETSTDDATSSSRLDDVDNKYAIDAFNSDNISATMKLMSSDEVVDAAVKGLINPDTLNKTQKKKYKKMKKIQEEEKRIEEQKQKEEDDLMDTMYWLTRGDNRADEARNNRNAGNRKSQIKQKENKTNQNISELLSQTEDIKSKTPVKLYNTPQKLVHDSTKTKVLQPVTNQSNKLSDRKDRVPSFRYEQNEQQITKARNSQVNRPQQHNNQATKQQYASNQTYNKTQEQRQQIRSRTDDSDSINNKVNKSKSSPEKRSSDSDLYRVTNYKSTLRSNVGKIFTDLPGVDKSTPYSFKNKMNKKENLDDTIDSVFAPKDITDDNTELLDATEKEVEEFKRFCFFNINADEKPKVNFNVKDIIFQKKKPLSGNL